MRFDEWKKERPATASLVNGTSIGDHAVVTMRGTRPDGAAVNGTYTLERVGGSWKVKGENWEPANR